MLETKQPEQVRTQYMYKSVVLCGVQDTWYYGYGPYLVLSTGVRHGYYLFVPGPHLAGNQS